MGQATVVALSEYQAAKGRAHLRARIHQAIDEWLDKVEAGMNEEKPTLEQITGEVFRLRQELTQQLTEALIDEHYQPEQAQAVDQCPECGQRLRARACVERSVETLVGRVKLKRPYFYCEGCKCGYYPLDVALHLGERRNQADVEEAVVKLTKEVPYETACELLEDLTGVRVSTHTAHEMTQEVGADLNVLDVSPSREEILKKITEASTDQSWRPILALAIDGAATPTRPEGAGGLRPGRKRVRARRARWKGEWKEAKGFRFYLVLKDRIVHLLSWHQIGGYEEVYEALVKIKEAGLIPEQRVRMCVVGDGAHWIWQRIKQELFPHAKEILDYYHCSEYIHRLAHNQYGDRQEVAAQWVEATMARLFYGEVGAVIWGLQRMNPSNAQAASEIERTINYLAHNQQRINYHSARQGGYPIGSGGIESAHKFISHVRLKRSGAWWYVQNGNQMLALRCAKYNGTFDRVCRLLRQ